MSSKLPDNAAAREVARLRGINADLDEQIRVLMEKKIENAERVGLLSNVANWIEPVAIPTEPDAHVQDPIKETGADIVQGVVEELEEAEKSIVIRPIVPDGSLSEPTPAPESSPELDLDLEPIPVEADTAGKEAQDVNLD